jgi:hypothetical protein
MAGGMAGGMDGGMRGGGGDGGGGGWMGVRGEGRARVERKDRTYQRDLRHQTPRITRRLLPRRLRRYPSLLLRFRCCSPDVSFISP